MPTTPFPFTYRDKKSGETIAQSWRDVHDKLGRDATSTALAFCTGHITPTATQSNIMTETVRREEATKAKAATQCDTSKRRATHGSPSPTAAAAPPRVLLTKRIADPREREALYSESGLGRRAYLNMRRQRPLNERFDCPKTTAQLYGWAVLSRNRELPELEGLMPRAASAALPEDYRKKSLLARLMRSNGVFGHSEFVP